MDEKTDIVDKIKDQDLKNLRKNMNDTKEGLAETLADIRERVSPDRMAQSAREATGELSEKAASLIKGRGENLKNVIDRFGNEWGSKGYALPLAAFGAASAGTIAYFLFRRLRQGEDGEWQEEYRIGEERMTEEYETEPYPQSEERQHWEDSGSEARERGRRLQQRADDIVHQVGERSRRLGNRARRRSERIGSDFLQTVKEHPFVTGAAAFCIGMLGGVLFPPTAGEDRMMGKASDQLKEKAKEATKEAKEGVKRVASETKEEAIRSARRIAEEAKRTTEEEGRKRGFGQEAESKDPESSTRD